MAGSQEVLEPGDTWNYTVQYTVKDIDICSDIVNNASVRAVGPCSSIAEDNDTQVVRTSYHASVDFEKVSDKSGEKVDLGDIITYNYFVRNTGNVNLSIVSIVDDMLGLIDVREPLGDSNSDGWLNLSEVWTYTASYEVQENDLCSRIKNRAVLNAVDPCKSPVYSDPAYAEVETVCNELICTCCDSGTNWDGIDIGNQKAISLHNSEAKNRVNIITDQMGGHDCRAKNGAKIITVKRGME